MCGVVSEELQARILLRLPPRGTRIGALELMQRLQGEEVCLSHFCAGVLALLDAGRARTEDSLAARLPAHVLQIRVERVAAEGPAPLALTPEIVVFPDRSLGRGSAASVFRGEDRRDGRPLAIKVLQIQGAPSPDIRSWFLERFRQEPLLMSRLDHPNVVKVFARGESELGPWYAMELLDGGTLSRRLRTERRLPADELRAAFRGVASALAAGARLGIQHRDVKPANIFVQGWKLADFGMAKTADAGPTLTMHGARIGTPPYMSPERASFGVGDARSDLYSLGATMYVAATGRPLFQVPSDDAKEWAAKHLRETPMPAVERAPGVPKGLSDILMRCLAKSPDERYPDFDALIAAIDALPA